MIIGPPPKFHGTRDNLNRPDDTETEWVETLEDGWNVLDPELTHLQEVAVRPRPTGAQNQPFGDGHAASRVVSALRSRRA